jgi:hypothetical protein
MQYYELYILLVIPRIPLSLREYILQILQSMSGRMADGSEVRKHFWPL